MSDSIADRTPVPRSPSAFSSACRRFCPLPTENSLQGEDGGFAAPLFHQTGDRHLRAFHGLAEFHEVIKRRADLRGIAAREPGDVIRAFEFHALHFGKPREGLLPVVADEELRMKHRPVVIARGAGFFIHGVKIKPPLAPDEARLPGAHIAEHARGVGERLAHGGMRLGKRACGRRFLERGVGPMADAIVSAEAVAVVREDIGNEIRQRLLAILAVLRIARPHAEGPHAGHHLLVAWKIRARLALAARVEHIRARRSPDRIVVGVHFVEVAPLVGVRRLGFGMLLVQGLAPFFPENLLDRLDAELGIEMQIPDPPRRLGQLLRLVPPNGLQSTPPGKKPECSPDETAGCRSRPPSGWDRRKRCGCRKDARRVPRPPAKSSGNG
jgi:hypothetical protein